MSKFSKFKIILNEFFMLIKNNKKSNIGFYYAFNKLNELNIQ